MAHDTLLLMGAVFIVAATPLLEIWIAIPLGLAMGLDPVLTAIAAALGNFIPLLIIVGFFEKVRTWYESRYPDGGGSKGLEKFRRIWDRYGLPVAALSAPASIGTHLAIIIILMLGTDAKKSLAWMAFSIIAWAIIVTPLAYYGIAHLG